MNALYTKRCKGFPKEHTSYRMIHPKKGLCNECQAAKNIAVKEALKAGPIHRKPPVDETEEYRLEGLSAAIKTVEYMQKLEWRLQ